ncbi:MAG: BatD family protein [Planctomycetes bacterium]|nr:BatD family protein [Planctomycetota bacterium]
MMLIHSFAFYVASLTQLQEPVQVELGLAQSSTAGSEVAQVYIGQQVQWQLDFWLRQSFQQEQLVSMFRQELDVPVQLQWNFAAAMPLPPEPGQLTLVFNGQLAGATVLPARHFGGEAYLGYRVIQDWRPEVAGEISIPALDLSYGFATQFREDLLNGRVAEDGQTAKRSSEAFTVKILDLPTIGQPAGFHGAVGQFQLRAEFIAPAPNADFAERPELTLGLDVIGEGNLAALEALPWPSESGFHCLGIRAVRDPAAPQKCSFYYSLQATQPGLTHLPALTMAYFDPRWPAGYKTVQSQSIAIPSAFVAKVDVAARAVDAEIPRNPLQPSQPEPRTAVTTKLQQALIILPWLLLAIIVWRAYGWRQQLVRKTRNPGQGDTHQPHAAAKALTWNTDAKLLAYELAAYLHCQPAALVCPNLSFKLQQAGLSAELANQAAATFEALIAVHYGGPSQSPSQSSIPDFIQRLHHEVKHPPSALS